MEAVAAVEETAGTAIGDTCERVATSTQDLAGDAVVIPIKSMRIARRLAHIHSGNHANCDSGHPKPPSGRSQQHRPKSNIGEPKQPSIGSRSGAAEPRRCGPISTVQMGTRIMQAGASFD